MARTYDVVVAPGGSASITHGYNQAKRPGGRVLVNAGSVYDVTNRDKIPLIHQPLWTDGSYSNAGAIWLGGGVKLPTSVGGPQLYN